MLRNSLGRSGRGSPASRRDARGASSRRPQRSDAARRGFPTGLPRRPRGVRGRARTPQSRRLFPKRVSGRTRGASAADGGSVPVPSKVTRSETIGSLYRAQQGVGGELPAQMGAIAYGVGRYLNSKGGCIVSQKKKKKQSFFLAMSILPFCFYLTVK